METFIEVFIMMLIVIIMLMLVLRRMFVNRRCSRGTGMGLRLSWGRME